MRISKIFLAFAITLMGNGATSTANIIIAGGALDSSETTVDVYVGTPVAGKVPRGNACQSAKKYVGYVQSGRYAEVAGLFAEDAVVLEPTRQHTIGRARIEEFYRNTIGKMKPEIVAVAYVGDDTDCMVSLAVRANIGGQLRYKLASVDHFTLNSNGKFDSMVAYIRP